MTLETTIQEMFNSCPLLFQTRKDCLNQLFCVIGNGYGWVSGELINHIQNNEEFYKDYESKLKAQLDVNGKAEQKQILKQPKNLIEEWMWYPLCKEYSALYNYPKDIKEDWLEGIEETKRLLIKDGINID